MFSLAKEQRVSIVIAISFSFLVLELVIGFRNHSLALVADAFHVTSDLIGFAVALVAMRMQSSTKKAPEQYSFGWQRAEILGGFFNGVFLLALGVSVLLQTIERFLSPIAIEEPRLVLIVGGIGLALNALSAVILGGHGHHHHHDHSNHSANKVDYDLDVSSHEGHAHTLAVSKQSKVHADMGVLGVFIHLVGDAINNVAVMVAAGVVLATDFIYADPIASAFVGLMIVATSFPLVLRSARLLLESAPGEVDFEGVGKDIMNIAGIEGVHEMHIWNLTQSKALATVHVVTSSDSLGDFMSSAQRINECLHHWGVHNVTIQPELVQAQSGARSSVEVPVTLGTPEPYVPQSPPLQGNTTCRLRCSASNCVQVCCD